MELSRQKRKVAYFRHRYDNAHYNVGEIVVVRRAPVSTGQTTKLQDRYHGSLLVIKVLSSDVYRVVDLSSERKSCFATTAHVSQLKKL